MTHLPRLRPTALYWLSHLHTMTIESNRIANGNHTTAYHREPLVYGGSLEQFDYVDLTNVIGREFSGVQLTDLMGSGNANVVLKDLAITSTSYRILQIRLY